METTTVSTKFQVVIPRAVRAALDIQPGQKMQVLVFGDGIQLIPIKPMHAYRGLARGIDTTVDRDEEDRP
jgi:AbrB family looped-hinge helix DNA binding protein